MLRNALVAEKICEVDRTDSFYIHNPYGGQPTATVQAIAGTYSVSAYTITDDSLTITDEFIYAEQVFDFERLLNSYDLMASRTEEMAYAVATRIDRYVLNNVLEDGTGVYTTPVGGFTSSANINVIIANLCSKVMGYSQAYNGYALVIENTDVVGFMQAQMANGFSYADAALNNGFLTSYGGVEIYVIRSGTFADETLGTKTYTNAGHRLFMVKNVATYCAPRGVQSEEKAVSAKTGREIVVYGYIGYKVWTQNLTLVIDITLA